MCKTSCATPLRDGRLHARLSGEARIRYAFVKPKLAKKGGFIVEMGNLIAGTKVNGSLPRAPHCRDPLYHMLESPIFPRLY